MWKDSEAETSVGIDASCGFSRRPDRRTALKAESRVLATLIETQGNDVLTAFFPIKMSNSDTFVAY
jgi:hypothetical protein